MTSSFTTQSDFPESSMDSSLTSRIRTESSQFSVGVSEVSEEALPVPHEALTDSPSPLEIPMDLPPAYEHEPTNTSPPCSLPTKVSAAATDVEEQPLPVLLIYEVRLYPRPLRRRDDVYDKWIFRCRTCTIIMLVAAIGFMNLVVYIESKRDNDTNEGRSLEDQCSNQHDTALSLAFSLGFLGADHWYAHHWLLAVLKSMWAFLHGVLFLIYRYGGHRDPYAAGFPRGLLWLSAFSFLLKIVTFFWYPIDAYLWSSSVYSIPGCLDRIVN